MAEFYGVVAWVFGFLVEMQGFVVRFFGSVVEFFGSVGELDGAVVGIFGSVAGLFGSVVGLEGCVVELDGRVVRGDGRGMGNFGGEVAGRDAPLTVWGEAESAALVGFDNGMVRVSHSGSYSDRDDPAATKIIRRWGPRLRTKQRR